MKKTPRYKGEIEDGLLIEGSTIVATGPHLNFGIQLDSNGTYSIQYGRSYGSQSGLTLDQVKKTVEAWVKKEIKKTEKVMEELKYLNRFMAKRIDKKAAQMEQK